MSERASTKGLSFPQRNLMARLAAGEQIFYSQDGEVGWLTPSRDRLEDFEISNRELQDLRDRGFIAQQPDEDEEYVRFSPGEGITPAGLLALGGPNPLSEGRERS